MRNTTSTRFASLVSTLISIGDFATALTLAIAHDIADTVEELQLFLIDLGMFRDALALAKASGNITSLVRA